MVRNNTHFAVKLAPQRTLLLPVNDDVIQVMAGFGRIALQLVALLGRIRL